MGRVPNCESVLVHKTNQIMTKKAINGSPYSQMSGGIFNLFLFEYSNK